MVSPIQGNERWTYRELDTVGNQLAHCLHAHAIGGGDLVAVYATRCAALVPALLGVLKAGAAFLILDSSYPPAALIERLLVVRPRGWIQLQASGSLPPSLAIFLEQESPVCRLELPAHSPALADLPRRPFLQLRHRTQPDLTAWPTSRLLPAQADDPKQFWEPMRRWRTSSAGTAKRSHCDQQIALRCFPGSRMTRSCATSSLRSLSEAPSAFPAPMT